MKKKKNQSSNHRVVLNESHSIVLLTLLCILFWSRVIMIARIMAVQTSIGEEVHFAWVIQFISFDGNTSQFMLN